METTKKNVPALRFPQFEGKWEKKRLGNISENVEYGIPASAIPYDGINKYLRITDIDSISRTFSPNPLTSPEGNNIDARFYLKANDIVFVRTGASVGKTYLYREEDGNIIFAGFLIRFSINKADSRFVFYNTLTYKYDKWVLSMSMRSGQPGINAKEFKTFNITFPTLPEQQKIADFLTTTDKRIELLQKKKDLCEQYKKAMMQKLFSQELRFKDENGKEFPKWEVKRLGNVFAHRSERGHENLELLSVTMNEGVKKRSDIEGKDNSSEDKSNYKRVIANDIVYNSMRMWQGASGLSPYSGIVSPAYTVLEPKLNTHSLYFAYLFKMRDIIHIFQRNSQGLTSDTWNLKYPQLSKIKVNVPSLPEQKKITDFLIALDKKIELVDKEIEQSERFKKYLLQNLFV